MNAAIVEKRLDEELRRDAADVHPLRVSFPWMAFGSTVETM
jgi:hypothetical protein